VKRPTKRDVFQLLLLTGAGLVSVGLTGLAFGTEAVYAPAFAAIGFFTLNLVAVGWLLNKYDEAKPAEVTA
jgi:hypothetical protein